MKTIYHILFSLLFVLAFVGCDDDDDKVIERNQLKLTASAQSATLTPDATDDEIISFSWNEATSLGADYTFSYLFQIDIADNNFQSATDVRTFGPNESISYSSTELYDLIVEKWGKTAGEAVYVEARVAAKVEGPKFKYPEIATTKVQITTYKPTSQPLYITGTATTGGTDLNAAEKITELSNGRLYNWRGQLKQGGFKFITTLDQTALEDLLALPAALDSGETVADVQELAVYGLETPKKYITVTSDGVDVVYYLGDQAADGRWYVLTPAGTVRYTSDENKMLLSRSIYAMAVLPVLPVIEPDRLVSVSLLRADGTAAVSFYTAEDGTRRSANRDVTEKTAALADEIAALTLTACVDYDPAEGAAAVCGLDTPEVTLTVNYLADNSAERTLILAVGLSTGDGGRYVALDGDTTIYRMEGSSLTQILTLSETGL